MKRKDIRKTKGFDFNIERKSGDGLAGRFIMPPFSVFRTTDADWKNRKKQWLALGIQSELGRGGHDKDGDNVNGVLFNSQSRLNEIMSQKKHKHPTAAKQGLTFGEMPNYHNDKRNAIIGTSIFDPVLTEILYTWFCPPSGVIIDPFAGGSVRGIVANYLGFKYWGSELRKEQVIANRKQGRTICAGNPPTWVSGDSVENMQIAPKADFIFTCPPYGDLEVYSDDPLDISNMSYDAFLTSYELILRRTARKLKKNRFAAVVVANFRDKKTGYYNDLVGDTVSIMQQAGLHYYNEGMLITPIGTLPIRVGRQFNATRKLGKTHQNILIFFKGNDVRELTNLMNDEE